MAVYKIATYKGEKTNKGEPTNWISKWISGNTKMRQVSITAVTMMLVMVQPETAEMAALAVQFDDTAGLLAVVVVAA